MSGDSRDDWSRGRLIRLCQALPPVKVDASTWEPDIPADQWTTGRLVTPVKALSRQVVDCSTWDAPSPWLELVVAFDPGSSPLPVVDLAERVIDLLRPQVRLSYDAVKSRPEGQTFVIVLVPHEKTTEERLALLASSLPPGSPSVRVARVA